MYMNVEGMESYVMPQPEDEFHLETSSSEEISSYKLTHPSTNANVQLCISPPEYNHIRV